MNENRLVRRMQVLAGRKGRWLGVLALGLLLTGLAVRIGAGLIEDQFDPCLGIVPQDCDDPYYRVEAVTVPLLIILAQLFLVVFGFWIAGVNERRQRKTGQAAIEPDLRLMTGLYANARLGRAAFEGYRAATEALTTGTHTAAVARHRAAALLLGGSLCTIHSAAWLGLLVYLLPGIMASPLWEVRAAASIMAVELPVVTVFSILLVAWALPAWRRARTAYRDAVVQVAATHDRLINESHAVPAAATGLDSSAPTRARGAGARKRRAVSGESDS